VKKDTSWWSRLGNSLIQPSRARRPLQSKADAARQNGDSGEAERLFRKEAERHSGMIPNTIGA